MAIFHFCNDYCYTVDGKPTPAPIERRDRFALTAWAHGCAPACAVVDPCDPCADGLEVIDFGNGHFLLSLSPVPLPPFPARTLQCVCECGKTRHLISCNAGSNAMLAVETNGEYWSVPCPVRAERMTAACTELSRGCLLRVTVCGDADFCCILFYDGDYRPLLVLRADSVAIDDGCVVARDCVGGMTGCTIERNLVFRGGRFCETERKFCCAHEHRYPDSLLGQLYLRRAFYRDPDCGSLLAPQCPPDAPSRIGDFDCVFDDDMERAMPGVVCVAKRTGGYCRARKLKFLTSHGAISDIIPIGT